MSPNEPSPTLESPSNAVKDVDLSSFKADVLDAPGHQLVLVFFWTPRSTASLALADTLEKTAKASNGAIIVAKVDVDHNKPLALQLGVQSIPSVFAFFQGHPIDAFAGALPDDQVQSWCDHLLGSLGIKQNASPSFEQALEQADERLANGDAQTAQGLYADVLRHDPENAKAHAGFIACLIADNALDQAKKSLDSLPAPLAKDHAFDKVRAALNLAQQAEKNKGQTAALKEAVAKNPDDCAARFDLALALYATGKKEPAVDQLLEIVRRNRTWNDGAARRQLVTFFEAFGDDDPLTVSARRRLSSLLFS
ncbi:MAG: tetratricopeptide repeat protein [Alphaproteobacteria bacterium]|nr:tetratricopeptide repeat protein [Alphaproteobacteria bacterium]